MKRNVKLEAWYNTSIWYLTPSLLFSTYTNVRGKVYEIELSLLCVTVLLSSKPKQPK